MNEHALTECEPWLDRLLALAADGGRVADDTALAAHLGTCLACFRAAAALRELPLVEKALRADAQGPDPGEAFWRQFPTQVADAWVRDHAVGLGARIARTWERFWRPLGAVLAGATAAAAIAMVPTGKPDQPKRTADRAEIQTVAPDVTDDEPESRGLSAAETIEQLDEAELLKLASAWGADEEL